MGLSVDIAFKNIVLHNWCDMLSLFHTSSTNYDQYIIDVHDTIDNIINTPTKAETDFHRTLQFFESFITNGIICQAYKTKVTSGENPLNTIAEYIVIY